MILFVSWRHFAARAQALWLTKGKIIKLTSLFECGYRVASGLGYCSCLEKFENFFSLFSEKKNRGTYQVLTGYTEENHAS